MMKGKKVKLFGLITLLCCCLAFAITACAQGGADRTVSITNKEELTAAWEEGGAERIVEFTVTEDGTELPDASVVVSSDNTSAVAVDGTTLSAAGGYRYHNGHLRNGERLCSDHRNSQTARHFHRQQSGIAGTLGGRGCRPYGRSRTVP